MSEVVIAAQQQTVARPEYNTKMGTEKPTPKSLLVSTPLLVFVQPLLHQAYFPSVLYYVAAPCSITQHSACLCTKDMLFP